MIKKPTDEDDQIRHIAPAVRRKTKTRYQATTYLLLGAMGAASFIVGKNLRRIMPHHPKPRIVDAMTVTFLDAGQGSSTLLQTNDGHALLIASDFDTDSAGSVLQQLRTDHIRKISALILTNATLDTPPGVTRLLATVTLTGPIVTPFGPAGNPIDESETDHDLQNAAESLGTRTLGWSECQAAMAEFFPMGSVQFFSPSDKTLQPAKVALRVTYQDSSVLDMTGLDSDQIASLTGTSFGGVSRILLARGQSQFLTKELLVEIQPDVVVLTGTADIPPVASALADVKASDAIPINLAATPIVCLKLPASSEEKIEYP